MSTQFGCRPQMCKGPPPTPVVPRSRVEAKRKEPRPTLTEMLGDMRERAWQAELDAAWESGFRAGEAAALRHVVYEPAPRDVMMEICEYVAEKHGLSVDDLRGHERTKIFSIARHEAIWLIAQKGWSTCKIGKFFNRDHTTVIWAIKAHEKRLAAAKGEGT